MSIIWGISAMSHDAAISVVDTQYNLIKFAAHAERYSLIKNDPHLNIELIRDALLHGVPDRIVWYENPLTKLFRHFYAGQIHHALTGESPKEYLRRYSLGGIPIEYVDHHHAHAATYYCGPHRSADVLVVDAIGEFTTVSIWHGRGTSLKKKFSQRYPQSVGLFYSAITQLVGLRPNEEEYILMGMAAYGNKERFLPELRKWFKWDGPHLDGVNCHRGLMNHWVGQQTLQEVEDFAREQLEDTQVKCDLAAGAQYLVEEYLLELQRYARSISDCPFLIMSGGVALNCVANSKLAQEEQYADIWMMPNPGDAGASLGAVAAYLGNFVTWVNPFLGHKIERSLDLDGIMAELLAGKPVGVANGRAEFGPRALGNRSLLADPRHPWMKKEVNAIKQRQEFRPFAPMILSSFVNRHFDLPGLLRESPYMQFTADTRDDSFPATMHVDNTSRVQTVDHRSPNAHAILKEWYNRTGCPALLNTSLNIRGEPLVNTWNDAVRFSETYGVKVF